MTAAPGRLAPIWRPSRRSGIAPFIVMDVMRQAFERQAEGANVVHLEVGQPSAAAPEGVRCAARAALASERLGYTEALGLPALRQRIARHYHETYGVEVDWQRIIVTTGSSGGFLLAFLAIFDAGQRVAVVEPGYPAYRNILQALDVEVVPIPVGEETGFQPTRDHLDRSDGVLDGLVLASPANPTGTMLGPSALADMVTACRDRGIALIVDEIYHGITFGTAATTALALGDDAIVVNSFSKYYAMTGWRLGWMVVPEPLLRPIERLAQNLFISPPSLSQHAAMAAFDCRAELDGHVAGYARNRDILMSRLPQAGLARFAPAKGAFYLYADVSHLTSDSEAFCRRMLDEAAVAATPGIDFDPVRGRRFVRFCFAGSTADVQEATERLLRWRVPTTAGRGRHR